MKAFLKSGFPPLETGAAHNFFAADDTVEKEKTIMKKIAICTLLLAAGTLLCACGTGDPTNENTDPAEVRSETLNEESWQKVFGAADNFTVKTDVVVREGEKETVAATYVYSRSGDEATLTLCVREGDACTEQDEAYLEYGEETTLWSRAKAGEDWGEWDSESYPEGALGFLGVITGDLSALKEQYANFSYQETEKGYVSEGEKLTPFAQPLTESCEGAFGMLDGLPTLERATVKTQSGKLSAFLADFKEGTEEEIVHIRPVRVALRLPHVRFRRLPDLLFEVPLPIRAAAGAEKHVSLEQVYYDYGKTTVTKPSGI